MNKVYNQLGGINGENLLMPFVSVILYRFVMQKVSGDNEIFFVKNMQFAGP